MSTPLAPVIQALRFDHPETSGLFQLDERILHWCDRAQLTLELGFRCSRSLPGHLRDRIHRNMESNRERTRRLELHLGEALSTLSKAGLDPIVLKGFAHSPEFVTDPARGVGLRAA
jgi:hypothetical protein